MRKRNVLALAAAAALAGAPALTNAAVMTFSWEISVDGGATYNPVTGPINITQGTEDYLGLLATTGTTNPNPFTSSAYSAGTHVQPSYLGVASFGLGLVDSGGTFTSLDPAVTDIAGQDAVQGNTDLATNVLPGPYTVTSG